MVAPTLKCRREARIYRTNWSPFCEKIFDFVRDVDFLVSNGASESIIIKADFSMNDVCYTKVAFKITLKQFAADSAYATEMKMYNLVSDFAFSGDIPFVMQYFHAETCSTAQFISNLPSLEMQKEFARQYVAINIMQPTRDFVMPALPDSLRSLFTTWPTKSEDVQRFVDALQNPAIAADQDKTELLIIMMERSEGSPLANWSDKYNSDMLVGLLAQILWTLSRFEQLGVMHHDLHLGNVFVENVDPPVTWKLFFGPGQDEFVAITTKYMAKIFDWDHACIVPHGKNTSVTVENRDLDKKLFCPRYGECNKFLKGRDAAQVLYHLRNSLHHRDFDGRDRLGNFLNKHLTSMDSVQQAWPGHACVCPDSRKVSEPGPTVSSTACRFDSTDGCKDVETLESPAEILRAMREEFNLRDTESSSQIRICSFKIDEAIASEYTPVDFEIHETISLISEERAKQLHEMERRSFSRDVDALSGVSTHY